MRPTLSNEHEWLHRQALDLCCKHRELEWQIIEILQKIESTKLYRQLELTSLFQYAVKFLKLSEPVAYGFITVARKAAQIEALRTAIRDRRFSVSKAARIVSAVTLENADELIAFAEENSVRAIDFEVARRNPKSLSITRVKPLSQRHVELRIVIEKSTLEKIERVAALVSQKNREPADFALVLDTAMTEFIQRHDPVKKADRALSKLCKTELGRKKMGLEGTNQKKPSVQPHFPPAAAIRRKPLTAKQKHQVFARDKGRCTHIGPDGARCANTYWLHIHHIRPVHLGGDNDLRNLTTLCSVHHDLAHQLSFPVDGQVTWLRAPTVAYG